MEKDDLGLWRSPELDLSPLRAHRAGALAQAGELLDAGVGGLALTEALSRGRDGLLALLKEALEGVSLVAPVGALYATGSYGGQCVCPGSDVDLLMVYEEGAPGAEMEAMSRWSAAFQTALRDIGLKVGMAHRTLDQCFLLARDEISIAASLLSARFLWGGGLRAPR